jgi:shikimate dehydrogenase
MLEDVSLRSSTLPDKNNIAQSFMFINGHTRVVGVLGHPIAHTASPAMHNAAFDKLKLNWRYLAFDVNPDDLGLALQGFRAGNLVGVNLTVPHKILALRHLDTMDSSARMLGASNTIHFVRTKKGTQITGHNTDGYGLLKALDHQFAFRPRGKTIALIGTGGAGQGAAIQLALAGVRKLILLNRTKAKAMAVARKIRSLHLKTQCCFNPEPCDLVIQATSLGMKSTDPLPLSRELLQELKPHWFFDMVYRPPETAAIRLAKKFGCKTANGLDMLLFQGAKAFEIWTGKRAPIEVMRRALKKEIYG